MANQFNIINTTPIVGPELTVKPLEISPFAEHIKYRNTELKEIAQGKAAGHSNLGKLREVAPKSIASYLDKKEAEFQQGITDRVNNENYADAIKFSLEEGSKIPNDQLVINSVRNWKDYQEQDDINKKLIDATDPMSQLVYNWWKDKYAFNGHVQQDDNGNDEYVEWKDIEPIQHGMTMAQKTQFAKALLTPNGRSTSSSNTSIVPGSSESYKDGDGEAVSSETGYSITSGSSSGYKEVTLERVKDLFNTYFKGNIGQISQQYQALKHDWEKKTKELTDLENKQDKTSADMQRINTLKDEVSILNSRVNGSQTNGVDFSKNLEAWFANEAIGWEKAITFRESSSSVNRGEKQSSSGKKGGSGGAVAKVAGEGNADLNNGNPLTAPAASGNFNSGIDYTQPQYITTPTRTE